MMRFIVLLARSTALRLHLIKSCVLILSLSACGEAEDDTSRDEASMDQSGSNTDALYQQHCSACHGDRGQGGVGRPLNGPHLDEMSDAQIFRMIYDGIGSVMPSFQSTLTTEEIADLTVYIRNLQNNN